jgi:hypothetical protein
MNKKVMDINSYLKEETKIIVGQPLQNFVTLGLNIDFINALNDFISKNGKVKPDITFFIDLNHSKASERIDIRGEEKNRIDKLKAKYVDLLYQVKREAKHRYVYVLANKIVKKQIMSHKKFDIKEYPKGDNLRYNANYEPVSQFKLL